MIPLGFVGFGLVFVAPGFGVGQLIGYTRWRRRPPETLPATADGAGRAFLLAIAWSALALAGVGAVLLPLGAFRPHLVAVALLLLALPGARDLVTATLRLKAGWPVFLFVLALSLPWAMSVALPGFPPAHTFQWYYWDLGRQLDVVGGLPAWSSEYGLHFEWLSSYVFSSVASEAYRSVFPAGSEVSAVLAWRGPLLVAALGALYLDARLWLGRAASVMATGAASASTLVLTKFGTYRPEAVGLLLGLVVLWLVVSGIRERRQSLVLLGGALLGVASGFNPISASAAAVVVVAAALVEWRLGAPDTKDVGRGLGQGAALAALTAAATGWLLQGRLSPLPQAANPGRTEGEDPTWTFLSLSEGVGPLDEPPTRIEQLVASLREPWPGFDLALHPELLLPIAVGLAAAVAFAGRGPRKLVNVLALSLVGLGLIGGAFAFGFSTYIPQYTGLVRVAQYGILLLAVGVGVALEGYRAALTSLGVGQRTTLPVAAAIGVLVVAWSVPTVTRELARSPRLSEEGLASLRVVDGLARPGEVILSNAATRGTIEFFTSLEAPLEGRQPVLEEPALLDAATQRLVSAYKFFDDPVGQPLPRAMVPNWVLITECPRRLGATHVYGRREGVIRRLDASPGLTPVWRSGCLALFRNPAGPPETAGVGPAEPRPWRLIAAVGVLAPLLLWLGKRARSLGAHEPGPSLRQARRRRQTLM